jgi:MoaA/NifB/PqqE/SkfB family radical SAM enzyme
MVMVGMAARFMRRTSPRLAWKFAWSGLGSLRAIAKFRKRLKQGVCYPPFLFVSITNACNLRCTGCWVTVQSPGEKTAAGDAPQFMPAEQLGAIITQAKKHGSRMFGLLGGEPFMHPDLMRILGEHRDCYFQVFTNGQFITREVAKELRKLGNVTPLISIEGSALVSDERRGRMRVLDHSLDGLRNCVEQKLITGVATSLCKNNLEDLLSEKWLRRLMEIGALYVWYYTYRPVGPKPGVELALSPEEMVRVRRFIVEMRARVPIGIVEAYWDAEGRAVCPMAMGISHHVNPWGELEPCPVIQFAGETLGAADDIFAKVSGSPFLADLRKSSAGVTRGCVMLERPEVLADVVERHGAADSSHRGTATAELLAMGPRPSHDMGAAAIPEKHWAYRFAKKHWFFGFGAYG